MKPPINILFFICLLLALTACKVDININEADKTKSKFLSKLEKRCYSRSKEVHRLTTAEIEKRCPCMVGYFDEHVSAHKLLELRKKSKRLMNDYLKSVGKGMGDMCKI